MATIIQESPPTEVTFERLGINPGIDDDDEAWANARARMRVLLETTDLAERLAEAFEREELKAQGKVLPPSTRKPFEPLKSR